MNDVMVNEKNFNAIVFSGEKFITYHKQSSLTRFKAFVQGKYPQWRWFTIYDRKTNEKEIIKRDNV